MRGKTFGSILAWPRGIAYLSARPGAEWRFGGGSRAGEPASASSGRGLARSKSPDILRASAGVAQLAERLTCNQQVGGSSPLASSGFAATKLGRDYAQTAP